MFQDFPYTDMHQLNLDWIVKIAKDFLDQYTHIQQLIEDGETQLQTLTEEGKQELEQKAQELTALLDEWYNTHSEDIAEALAGAIADLNAWYTEHENYLDQTLADNILAFNTAAAEKAAETIASIPADYTTLANTVMQHDDKLEIMEDSQPIPLLSFDIGKNVNATGVIEQNLYTALSTRWAVSPGDKIIRKVPQRDNDNLWMVFYVSEFNGDTFIQRNSINDIDGYVIIGPNTNNIMISLGRTTSSGVQMTQADIDTYFDVRMYRQVTVTANDFIWRGDFSSLGYTALSQAITPGYYAFRGEDNLTDLPDGYYGGGILQVFRRSIGSSSQTWQRIISTVGNYIRYGTSARWYVDFSFRNRFANTGYTSLAECIMPGYYFFSGSDSISDLPDGWTGGGILIVYSVDTSNPIWQQLVSTTGSYIRYGTTGPWISKHNSSLVRAAYSSTAGSDDSTEQLDIYIPLDDNGTTMRYNMGHCINQNVNAAVWRLMYAYLVGNNGNSRQMTIQAEWECALHLQGRDDFSGGIVHGDEIQDDLVVFADGVETDISALTGFYKEIKIVRYSRLFDPLDHVTVIATHGVEYIFNQHGITINQAINWKVSAALTACYLAMMPVVKAYSTYRFDDTSFEPAVNNQNDYSVTIPNADSVTEWSDTYKDLFTMKKSVYPSGLPGGDCALVTDNGGRGYNKVYFPVCTSGNVTADTLWKATVQILNK